MILDNFYVDNPSKILDFGIKDFISSSIKTFIEIIGNEYVSMHIFFLDFSIGYIDSATNYFNKFNSIDAFRIPYNSNLNFYVSINNITNCEFVFNIINPATNKKVSIVIAQIDTTLSGDVRISSIL